MCVGWHVCILVSMFIVHIQCTCMYICTIVQKCLHASASISLWNSCTFPTFFQVKNSTCDLSLFKRNGDCKSAASNAKENVVPCSKCAGRGPIQKQNNKVCGPLPTKHDGCGQHSLMNGGCGLLPTLPTPIEDSCHAYPTSNYCDSEPLSNDPDFKPPQKTCLLTYESSKTSGQLDKTPRTTNDHYLETNQERMYPQYRSSPSSVQKLTGLDTGLKMVSI